MNGVYLTPISHWIEIGLAVSGLLIVFYAARAFLSSHAWGDGAEYEMLDLEQPADPPDGAPIDRRAARAGVIGIEDRVVRFGFSLALTLLALIWFGIGSLAMWISIVPGVYFLITGVVGKDPVYRRLGITTHMD